MEPADVRMGPMFGGGQPDVSGGAGLYNDYMQARNANLRRLPGEGTTEPAQGTPEAEAQPSPQPEAQRPQDQPTPASPTQAAAEEAVSLGRLIQKKRQLKRFQAVLYLLQPALVLKVLAKGA